MREIAKQEMAEGRRVHRKIINVSSTSGVAGNPGQADRMSKQEGEAAAQYCEIPLNGLLLPKPESKPARQ